MSTPQPNLNQQNNGGVPGSDDDSNFGNSSPLVRSALKEERVRHRITKRQLAKREENIKALNQEMAVRKRDNRIFEHMLRKDGEILELNEQVGKRKRVDETCQLALNDVLECLEKGRWAGLRAIHTCLCEAAEMEEEEENEEGNLLLATLGKVVAATRNVIVNKRSHDGAGEAHSDASSDTS